MAEKIRPQRIKSLEGLSELHERMGREDQARADAAAMEASATQDGVQEATGPTRVSAEVPSVQSSETEPVPIEAAMGDQSSASYERPEWANLIRNTPHGKVNGKNFWLAADGAVYVDLGGSVPRRVEHGGVLTFKKRSGVQERLYWDTNEDAFTDARPGKEDPPVERVIREENAESDESQASGTSQAEQPHQDAGEESHAASDGPADAVEEAASEAVGERVVEVVETAAPLAEQASPEAALPVPSPRRRRSTTPRARKKAKDPVLEAVEAAGGRIVSGAGPVLDPDLYALDPSGFRPSALNPGKFTHPKAPHDATFTAEDIERIAKEGVERRGGRVVASAGVRVENASSQTAAQEHLRQNFPDSSESMAQDNADSKVVLREKRSSLTLLNPSEDKRFTALTMDRILRDKKKQELFGELLAAQGYADLVEKYTTDAATMSERDQAALRQMRLEFTRRLAFAEEIRDRITTADLALMLHNNPSFGTFADSVNPERATEIVKDHLFKLFMREREEYVNIMVNTYREVDLVRSGADFARLKARTDAYLAKYPHAPEHFDRYIAQRIVRESPEQFASNLPFLSKQNIFKKMIPGYRRKRDAEVTRVLDINLESIGNILAASITKDKDLVRAAAREANEGVRMAETGTHGPATFTEMQKLQRESAGNYTKEALTQRLESFRTAYRTEDGRRWNDATPHERENAFRKEVMNQAARSYQSRGWFAQMLISIFNAIFGRSVNDMKEEFNKRI